MNAEGDVGATDLASSSEQIIQSINLHRVRIMLKQLAVLLKPTLAAAQRRWLFDLALGLAIAAGVMVLASMSASRFYRHHEPPAGSLAHWSRAPLVVEGRDFLVITRPMVFGDIHGVFASSSQLPNHTPGEVESAIDFVAARSGADPPPSGPTHILIDRRISESPLSWLRREQLRRYCSVQAEYLEVLVARAPFPFAAIGASSTLLEASSRVIGTARGMGVIASVPPTSLCMPGLLLGSVPAQPYVIGVALNACVWIGVVFVVRFCATYALCAIRYRHGKCMVCGYPVGASAACSECGTPRPSGEVPGRNLG